METPPLKSSFVRHETSKEDAILQFLRPQIGAKLHQALDHFERMVTETETLVRLGTRLRTRGHDFFVTPTELKANLDEFGELVQFADEGRKLLDSLGYVPSRKESTPFVQAPVGKSVDVQAITMLRPGEVSTEGVIVRPKKKSFPPPDAKA